MDVSRPALVAACIQTLATIEKEIEEVGGHARIMGIEPYRLRDANGSWVLIPLLQAKAMALNALIQVQKGPK